MAISNVGHANSFTPEAAITSLTDNSGGTASNTLADISTWGTALTDNTGATPSTTISDGDTQGTAMTDNSTGAAGTTIAAGVGVYQLTFGFLAPTFANGDMITGLVIPHKFKILKLAAVCTDDVSTGAKATTLNLEIGTTNLTGGVLTLDGVVALGAYEAGSAITAANTGAAGDNISLEASATTTFVEGSFEVIIDIQNMDTADAIASLSAKSNLCRTDIGTLNTSASSLATKINLGITDAGNTANAIASLAAKGQEVIAVLRADELIRT